MSNKYSDVREYLGGLLFENRKNQNYVEINPDGIKYSRNNETPAPSFFELKLDGDDSSTTFYRSIGNNQLNAEMSAFGIAFNVSGDKNQRVGISALTGLYFTDTKKNKQNQMTADGLVLIDGTTNQKCTLKFENGVLKINGKEIATVENS